MAIPPRYLNAEIIEITRPNDTDYGGGTPTVVVKGPIPCNRQTKIERNFGSVQTRFTAEGPAEQTDAAFYTDLFEDPSILRVGDRIKWRRVRSPSGVLIVGPEIEGAEIRRLDVHDGIIGGRRTNTRMFTRGGDGTGV